MSFITQDATLQNEILNLNQSVIDNFSVIQEFLQSNLDTLTLSNELAQAAIDWDLPTQFEDLKNRYDLALFSAVEGLTTFLGEASALQNEDVYKRQTKPGEGVFGGAVNGNASN